MEQVQNQQQQSNPNLLEIIIDSIDSLQKRKYVSSVYFDDGNITILYNNGFKGKIKLPDFDSSVFKDECLKYVNIKLAEQNSKIISLLKDKISKISKQDGPVGPKGDQGETGERGQRGNGIKNAVIEQDGHLIISTDDRKIDAGEVSIKRFYGAEVNYSNELGMPESVGGLKKGTRFSQVNFRVLMTKLLYGYEFPFFNVFEVQNLPKKVEIGYTLPSINTTAIFEIQNIELLKCDSITIKQGNKNIVNNLPNVSPVSIKTNEFKSDVLATNTFEIYAYDTTGVSFNSYYYISFLYKIYYGEYGEDITDNGFDNPLIVLRASELLSDIEGEYLYIELPEGSDNYKWFCYPAILGENYIFYELVSDVGIVLDDVRKITVKNEHGLEIEYNCYRTLYQIKDEFVMGVKRG